MTKNTALDLALEALESCTPADTSTGHVVWPSYDEQAVKQAIIAIKQARSAPVQETVAIDGNTSDGYHTFNELYEFRKAYNAALFNEWAVGGKCYVHKSWRHHDGELCFGGGWFIVVAVLPQGQISNHYEAKDWDLFAVPEVERALFEFDGHTGADVVERLKAYTTPPAAQRQFVGLTEEEENALIPDPDGSAEANVRRVEVLPGAWGKEYEEVDAWSKPLVLQMLHDHEAKLRSKNT